MNDLAEKALYGLDAARRQVRDRPVLSFSVAGAVVATVIVVSGGAVGAAGATRPLTTWLGLQDPRGAQATDPLPGAVMLAGVVALLALWIAVLRYADRAAPPIRRIWWMAGAWALPLAVGPPLMDTSVYSYAAFGLLQRSGLDPTRVPPTGLGALPVVEAIDPASRGVPSSAPPLGTVVQHLAVSVSGGSALGAVIVLRVVAVLAVGWLGRLAAELGGARSGRALVLTLLNPLVLLYVVSAAHLDGLVVALVLCAVVAARQRRWALSVGLAAVAGCVGAPALAAVPAVIAAHLARRRGRPVWRVLASDLCVAVVVLGGVTALAPDGSGWLRTVGDQFSTSTPFSVAGVVSAVLAPVVPGASYDDLAIGGRVAAAIAMICVVVTLLLTARQRPLDRTIGGALLAVGLLAPVLHPWYLLWGALCLAPTATGTRRVWVVALSAAGCLLDPGGFTTGVGNGVTAALLFLLACVLAIRPLRQVIVARAASGTQRPPETSRTAGRTSAR